MNMRLTVNEPVPRMYTQIYTPTVVQGKGGGGCGWTILWVVVVLEACSVTNSDRHLGRHLGFYQELEIKLKPREIVISCALHEK